MVDIASWNAAIESALKAYKDGRGAIASIKISQPVLVDCVEYWSDEYDIE